MVEIDHQHNRVLFMDSHPDDHAEWGSQSPLESFGEEMQGSRTISTTSEPQCPHELWRKERRGRDLIREFDTVIGGSRVDCGR